MIMKRVILLSLLMLCFTVTTGFTSVGSEEPNVSIFCVATNCVVNVTITEPDGTFVKGFVMSGTYLENIYLAPGLYYIKCEAMAEIGYEIKHCSDPSSFSVSGVGMTSVSVGAEAVPCVLE